MKWNHDFWTKKRTYSMHNMSHQHMVQFWNPMTFLGPEIFTSASEELDNLFQPLWPRWTYCSKTWKSEIMEQKLEKKRTMLETRTYSFCLPCWRQILPIIIIRQRSQKKNMIFHGCIENHQPAPKKIHLLMATHSYLEATACRCVLTNAWTMACEYIYIYIS